MAIHQPGILHFVNQISKCSDALAQRRLTHSVQVSELFTNAAFSADFLINRYAQRERRSMSAKTRIMWPGGVTLCHCAIAATIRPPRI